MEGWEESKMGQKLNVLLMYFIDAPAGMCGQKIFTVCLKKKHPRHF